MDVRNSFVLEISRHDAALSMSCFRNEELSSTIRHYGQRQVNFTEIDTLCRELIFILNKSAKNSLKDQALVDELKKTGQLLWEHLLTKPVKDMLLSVSLGNLTLLLDEELVAIPWELLYDRQEFLCLKFNVGRLIRARQLPAAQRLRDSGHVLSMLILANPTGDLPCAYREGLQIKNQCMRKQKEMRIDFKSTAIDTLYVKKNLCDYDIVHFAGHCEYDRDDHRRSGWVLQDGRFTTHDIMSLGEGASLPSLVFSNACYSAGVASGAIDMECQKKTYSLASAFLFSGVRHYLGTIGKIEDQESLVFAHAFYSRVLKGDGVGEAMRQARITLVREFGTKDLAWASYLLYGDPSFVFLRTIAKSKLRMAKIAKKIRASRRTGAGILFGIGIVVLCAAAYVWLSGMHPGSYFLYRQARVLFSEGRNQEAGTLAGRIISRDPAYLPAYPLLADAWVRQCNKEQGLRYYFEYAMASEKKDDPARLASAYLGIGWLYHGYREYEKAHSFYTKALALSRRHNDLLNEAIALRRLAVWNIDKEEYDVALGLLTKSSEINQERQHIPEHRYNLACDYFDIGLVFINKNDFEAARKFYTKSFHLLEKMNLKGETGVYYFNLGEICLFEKEYQKALAYYLRGLAIDQGQENLPSLAADFNMLGQLYADMDRTQDAAHAFLQSIAIAERIQAPWELASASFNLGTLYQKTLQYDAARKYFLKALELYAASDPREYQRVKKNLQDVSLPDLPRLYYGPSK